MSRRHNRIRFTIGNELLSDILRRYWKLMLLLVGIVAVFALALAIVVNASEEILLPAKGSPAANDYLDDDWDTYDIYEEYDQAAQSQQKQQQQPYNYRTDPAFACFPDRIDFDVEIVSALQQRLTEYGYYTPVTGRFDETTGMSVKQFQLDYGLACDGVVGDATYDALNFNTARWSFSSMWYTADLRHVAYVIPCEFIYYVNCGDDPHLTVYHKTDNGWKRTASYPCVVGASTSYDNITPLGYHEIWSRDEFAFEHGGLWYYNPVFYTVCDDPETDSFYESQYGIHSVAYDPSSEVWEDWVLDRSYYPNGKITNGCVRVDPNAAEWLQGHSSIGTPIVVDDRDYADVIR